MAGWEWMQTAALAAVMLAMALPATAQSAALPNRIQGALSAAQAVSITGSVPALARRATDLGPVDPSMQLGSMSMNFGLSASQQAELDALLAAQHDPKSPQYHQWLTQKQYGERFGMTDADLQQAESWLRSQGLSVTGVSTARNAIYFRGLAWQVESAFQTELHRYQWLGAQHFANASELKLPAPLAGVVMNIRGVSNFHLQPQAVRRPAPAYTTLTTQGVTNFLVPGDWATIYNVDAIYSAGYTGSGAYVGVVGQTYAPQADIDNFRSAAGLPATNLSYVCISTAVNCTDSSSISNAGDLTEADLDIEWAGGIAKNATVVYVYAAYDDPSLSVIDALQYAVNTYTVPATGKPLPVISMSYDDCEASFSGNSSYFNYVKNLGQEANAQGQTIVVSSGDTGADCVLDTGYPASMGEYVSVPPDSPNFTGVGGTTLNGDETDPATYWNQTVTTVDSALQYIPETAWNDTSTSGLSASTGGVSQYFAQPDGSAATGGFIQPTPSNFSGTAKRFVPDIAFAASPEHDGYLICSQDNNSSTTGTDCSTGFVSSKGYFDVLGGTSAGTPSFAGMLTLLEQRFGPQGNFNTVLYSLAANPSTYASVFHDITTGDNIVPCTVAASDPGCVGGQMGYSAATGYDLTTGLGSVNGGALYAAMATTGITVSASPNPAVMNGTTTLTATVSSNASGTITGTVTFALGTTTLGTAAVSGGSASLTVAVTSANGFVYGGNTITATYGGDASFTSSTGTTVVTATKPTTSVSLSASANPVLLNGTETLTATVTSATAGTITGTVTFTLNTVTLGTATLSSGKATLTNVAVTSANGFFGGTDTVVAAYGGDSAYAASSGSTQISVQSFSLTAPSSISMTAGTSATATLNLTSSNFAGPVTFTVTSSNAAEVTGSAPSVTLTANGGGSTTLTVTAAATAANRAPALPWKHGGGVAFALLLGAPLALRKRRVLAALLLFSALSLGGLLISCSSNSTTSGNHYVVTVTPQPAAASPVNINVYVR